MLLLHVHAAVEFYWFPNIIAQGKISLLRTTAEAKKSFPLETDRVC